MKCPQCDNSHTRKASQIAYKDGVYFCLDCAIYFPTKILAKQLEDEN